MTKPDADAARDLLETCDNLSIGTALEIGWPEHQEAYLLQEKAIGLSVKGR
jgi:hypothetical protein